jgi:putative intracellular protease/amidase
MRVIALDKPEMGLHRLAMAPKSPPIPPNSSARKVDLLAFPDVQLLDVAGPLQVFASANERAAEQGLARPYVVTVVAPEGQITATAGLRFDAAALPTRRAAVDTLIVAGGQGVMRAAADTELVDWVRGRAGCARRVASVCTGAFLLGAAGLLNGRRAVTHWEYCDRLARRHPLVTVDPDPIFIMTGRSGRRPASPPASISPSRWSRRTSAARWRWRSPGIWSCFSSGLAGRRNSARP